MGTADAAAAAAIGGRLAPAPTPGPGPGPAPPVPEAAAAAVPRYASRDASAALARPSREASAEATNARRVLSSSTFRRASFAARTRSRSDSGKAEGGRRGGGPCACGLLFALSGRLSRMSTMPPPPLCSSRCRRRRRRHNRGGNTASARRTRGRWRGRSSAGHADAFAGGRRSLQGSDTEVYHWM